MDKGEYTIQMQVNGKPTKLSVQANETLLDVLRERLGLTGAKFGCGNGECGACTVIKDGKVINACLVLAVECDSSSIRTIEGLSTDHNLHPVQKAFVENFAIQCGFCSPGIIMSTVALLEVNPSPTRAEIKEALNGNLCRCTGYVNIIKAVEAAALALKEA